MDQFKLSKQVKLIGYNKQLEFKKLTNKIMKKNNKNNKNIFVFIVCIIKLSLSSLYKM